MNKIFLVNNRQSLADVTQNLPNLMLTGTGTLP